MSIPAKDYCRYCGPGVNHDSLIALGICNGQRGKECQTIDTIYICERHYEDRAWRIEKGAEG